jgi:hypothetical protein
MGEALENSPELRRLAPVARDDRGGEEGVAARNPVAKPAASTFQREGLPVTHQSAAARNSSAGPCCHSAWLLTAQVSVPKAKAPVRRRASRRSSRRRRTRNIRPTAAAATHEAATFSMRAPARRTFSPLHPTRFRYRTAGP